jgi:hypothetical protein
MRLARREVYEFGRKDGEELIIDSFSDRSKEAYKEMISRVFCSKHYYNIVYSGQLPRALSSEANIL